MNEAETETGGSRVLAIARKFRAAGMPLSQAEAVAEELGNLPTRAEMREELAALEKRLELKIELALARQFQKTVWLVLGTQTLGVAVLALLLK